MTNPNQNSSTPKGSLLKKERESKNISLDTVQEATKIPLDVLKAIEEGYTIRTLSLFYLKGFVKMYAQYLGVDPDKILKDFRFTEEPQTIKKIVLEKKPISEKKTDPLR